MDPALEKQILENLTKSNIPSPQSVSYDDQLSGLVSQMEKHSVNAKLEKAFLQIMGKTEQTEITDDSFQAKQTLKSIMSGGMLKKGFGASISGQIGGIIQGFLPINLGIQGVGAILGGLAISRFAKGSTGSDISEGVIIGGISLAVGGLIGGSLNLSSLLGSRTTSTNSALDGVVL